MLIFFNIKYFRTDHSKSGNKYIFIYNNNNNNNIIKKKKKKTQLGDKASQHHLHHKRFGFIFWIARLPQIELKLKSGLTASFLSCLKFKWE